MIKIIRKISNRSRRAKYRMYRRRMETNMRKILIIMVLVNKKIRIIKISFRISHKIN